MYIAIDKFGLVWTILDNFKQGKVKPHKKNAHNKIKPCSSQQ